MLLSRPFPKKHETLPSYLLRITEANGYKNIMQLLTTERIQFSNNRLPSKKIFFGEFDLERIASLANVESSELHSLKLLPYSSNHCSINGRIYSNKSLNFANVRICPECYREIKQFQFINVLMPKTYCTRHLLPLVSIHPTSGKLLTWGTHYLWREIRHSDGNHFHFDITDAEYKTNVLIENAEHHTLDIAAHQIDLPGLCDLLSFFSRFQQLAFKNRLPNIPHSHVNYCRQYYLPTSYYLENWPNSYFDLLAYFEKNPLGHAGITGVRKCFRDLYDDIYTPENRHSSGYQLLRSSFENYLN
uniref:TniQ family protein n=1 Tax=Rheinheimera soli TaxID=443616 RepID=UPI001E28B634